MKPFYYLLLLVLSPLILHAQVGINQDSSPPDSSSMLDIKSNNKGILIPRLSRSQIDSILNPANGLIVFCTDDQLLYSNQGTNSDPTWTRVNGPWVYLDSNIYYQNGKVGIGTVDPAKRLHVNGNIKGDTIFYSALSPSVLDTTNVLFYGAKGDGMTDDYLSIEYALSKNLSILRFPKGKYVVSNTIRLPSNTHLKLDPGATLFLQSNANTLLLTNDNWLTGNENIIIEGGTFDGNGVNQIDLVGVGTDPDTYHGTMIRLQNIHNLKISNTILKDPQWFGLHLGKVRNFYLTDIVLDYRQHGGDGVHISGLCNNGYIENLRDPYGARRDDFLAFMSDDAPQFNITPGEIRDIVVNGVISERTGPGDTFKSGVDFLDLGKGIHDISVSNVIGEFSYAGVQFMNFGLGDHETSNIYNIFLNNIAVSIPDNSAMGPIIIRTNIKNLIVNGLVRRQLGGNCKIETVQIIKGAVIEDLIMNNIQIIDSTTTGLKAGISVGDSAVVKNLMINNWSQKRVGPDAPAILLLVDNVGTINNIYCHNVSVENGSSEAVFDFRRHSNIGCLSITNSSFTNVNYLIRVNVQNIDTSSLNKIYLSNIQYNPRVGTENVVKLLFNIRDTVDIRATNTNLSSFPGNPISKYPSSIHIRLNSLDFPVNAVDLLSARVNDIVIHKSGSTNIGPVAWNGTGWIPLMEPAGISTGDMLYWNGTDWIILPVGQEGQVLKISGGAPAWTNP